MTKKGLIWTVVAWIILTIVNYYFIPYFFLALIWFGLSFILLIVALFQLGKLLYEIKRLTEFRVLKFLTFATLFLLTFFHTTTSNVIEKIDWFLLENRRTEIINLVKNDQLNLNVKANGWVYELPYKFPVVSNGGNEIGIVRNQETNDITVTFWVFRNYFDSPSIHFIYTDNPEAINIYEKRIINKPENNWKIKKNWYRIYDE
ncbi:hypothetical protein [Brumimicrobium sp.]|uniref:hypothetical protein n=1 Tax=Brumimicrobium sp. TaxID=2029867 RepID=UPI002C11DBB7|nr:hypothetical protein [Flavobacterium sp.]